MDLLLLLFQVVVYVLQILEMLQIVGGERARQTEMGSENVQALHKGVTLAYVLFSASMFWSLNVNVAHTAELLQRVCKLENSMPVVGQMGTAWVAKTSLESHKVLDSIWKQLGRLLTSKWFIHRRNDLHGYCWLHT